MTQTMKRSLNLLNSLKQHLLTRSFSQQLLSQSFANYPRVFFQKKKRTTMRTLSSLSKNLLR